MLELGQHQYSYQLVNNGSILKRDSHKTLLQTRKYNPLNFIPNMLDYSSNKRNISKELSSTKALFICNTITHSI